MSWLLLVAFLFAVLATAQAPAGWKSYRTPAGTSSDIYCDNVAPLARAPSGSNLLAAIRSVSTGAGFCAGESQRVLPNQATSVVTLRFSQFHSVGNTIG